MISHYSTRLRAGHNKPTPFNAFDYVTVCNQQDGTRKYIIDDGSATQDVRNCNYVAIKKLVDELVDVCNDALFRLRVHTYHLNKNRLEAFSDGVLAIILTIMVLELKVPQGSSLRDLTALLPIALSYVMSFFTIGTYWGNHHHLLLAARKISAKIILANLHLLFWLSLIPFTTGWMGENHFAANPVALYLLNSLVCGVAYFILQKTIEKNHHTDATMIAVLKKQSKKAIFSQIMYAVGIPLAYVNPYISVAIFFVVSVVWVIPDREIEKAVGA